MQVFTSRETVFESLPHFRLDPQRPYGAGNKRAIVKIVNNGDELPMQACSLGARSDIIKLCTGPAKRYQTWRELGTPLQQRKAFYWLRPDNHEEIQDIIEEHNQTYSTMPAVAEGFRL